MICATHVQDNDGVVNRFAKLTSEIMCNYGNELAFSAQTQTPLTPTEFVRNLWPAVFTSDTMYRHMS
jgi:hypothetical protein